jgi:hypothetical protein
MVRSPCASGSHGTVVSVNKMASRLALPVENEFHCAGTEWRTWLDAVGPGPGSNDTAAIVAATNPRICKKTTDA